MSFLAPLFLLGVLAAALPVLFHLVRRTTRERTIFSSLMFLRPAPPHLTRRHRLEHLLLLLLRCAVIGLLALGFARPFLKHALPESTTGAEKRIVVLLDASASMQRGKLWSDARDKAEAILRKAAYSDQAALFTFDRELKPLISFEQWKSLPTSERSALVHQRLSEAKPGWSGTYLDLALLRAAEMLAEIDKQPGSGPRQVVLVSDLQASSRLQGLQGYDWPKGVELIVERVVSRRASNAGLHWVADSADTPQSAETTLRVRVSNEADSTREQFQVGWAGAGGAFISNHVDIYVPPGQSRVVALPTINAPGADRVLLQGDDENFDNTVFIVPPAPTRPIVVYFGNESETDTREPLYFLKRAFQETRRQSVQVLTRQPGMDLQTEEMGKANLFVLTGNLPLLHARSLGEQVKKGKTLLVLLTSTAAASTLANILGIPEVRLREAAPASYAMFGEIDFHHPLFAPFADPRFSDFTKIHFWKYRRVETNSLLPSRTLARFDNGDPAILELALGKGRVLLFAAGWHPADSQLALSSKFIPLLYSVLELSGATPPAPPQFIAGDVVPLPVHLLGTNALWSVLQPDGKQLMLPTGSINFEQALMPGVYRVSSGSAVHRFAINLDPAESRTAPLPLEELERLGIPSLASLNAPVERERKLQLQNAELESRQKLWRWFIVGTVAVLLTETWLAGRTARQLAVPGEVTP